MLFNSFEFIFLFFPITLALFYTIAGRWSNEAAIGSLVLSSLFFYGWWNPKYLFLLLLSMVVNYRLGRALSERRHKVVLVLGIVFNLSLIAYFKYAGFILDNINGAVGVEWNLGTIILPLAISFFTFQQIAYLVDSYRGITKEYQFVHYALFVSFFPQLIAGPIVHHKDMLPQFNRGQRFRLNPRDVSIGLSIFAIGLFKKTVIADGVAEYANPVFSAADSGETIDFFTAWGGALAYTFQLYFDFSGYSDMAIGLARVFGIILPLNFYSPYKAANISEFWRRWHITLSTFLRDYVYISLGGNRKGKVLRYSNLMVTMLLGGLWHGAGWNFVIWGGLHGLYLCINHGWQALIRGFGIDWGSFLIYRYFSWLITFVAVVIGWVYFRAVTLDGAHTMVQGMIGLNGFSMPNGVLVRLGELGAYIRNLGVTPINGGGEIFVFTWVWNILLMMSVVLLPNVQDLFAKEHGSLSQWRFRVQGGIWPAYRLTKGWCWNDSWQWAAVAGACAALGALTLSQVSEFLYFQF